ILPGSISIGLRDGARVLSKKLVVFISTRSTVGGFMNLNVKKWQWCVCFLSAAMLLMSCANAAYGQASFATITGRAPDPKGASVPGATVTATNTETGIVRTTTTTSDGLYRFDNLPPGVYDVAIETSSFSKAEAKNIKLQVGESRDINFNLELAGQRQSVV